MNFKFWDDDYDELKNFSVVIRFDVRACTKKFPTIFFATSANFLSCVAAPKERLLKSPGKIPGLHAKEFDRLDQNPSANS